MNFLKRLTVWGWIEVIFFVVVFSVDNFTDRHDGLWLTLIIVATSAIVAIGDEMNYYYSMPVNHPEQCATEKEVLANFIRSWLGLFMCLAPILYGPIWLQIIAVIVVVLAGYSVVASHRLYSFTSGDVKYEG